MMATIADVFWREYAATRWSENRAAVVRAELDRKIHRIYSALEAEAEGHKGKLAFAEEALRLAVIRSLDVACEYCGNLYGVESFGVVRRNPILRTSAGRHGGYKGGNPARMDWTLRAYAVACQDCTKAKHERGFDDAQWLEVLNALRKCDDAVARDAVGALAGVVGTPPRGRGCG